ncbi:MAG: phosphatidate cytidylyltransferase [Phycisphaerales bacterium]|nr:phosphatidate cytidylyltransferase [Phycisphaerales bacterium]
MLKYRLLLSPALILLLIATLWGDQWLDHIPVPPGAARFQWLSTTDGTFPPGLIILLVGIPLVALAARELGAMFHAGGVDASRRWMTIAAVAGLVVFAAVPLKTNPLTAVALVATVGTVVLVGALAWHVRDKNMTGATAAVGAAMFAFVYLGLMFGFLLAIRREHSAWAVAGVMLVTKSCDIGAYCTGRAIGKHKLIPWLSPGKTWEGLFGGMALAAGVAVGAVALHRATLGTVGVGAIPMWIAALFGVILAVAGQAGDLLESVFKRDAGLKDSGRSIPGFGGVLDVLDSLLLTAPVAFWLLSAWAAP